MMREKTSTRAKKIAVYVLCVILLGIGTIGCSFGPRVLKGNRLDYNVSIQRSNNEELLVNLIRAKYFEHPFFLQVGSVSASFEYSATAGLGATIYEKGGASASSSISPNLGAHFSENPTITYSPVQGEQNARRLLAEISLEQLVLLARAGCRMDIIMRMMVKEFGNLNASPLQKLKTPDIETSYDRFLGLAKILTELQEQGNLEFVNIERDKQELKFVTFQMHNLNKKELERVEELLGIKLETLIDPRGHFIVLIKLVPVMSYVNGPRKEGIYNIIPVKLRNFIEVLYHLAGGVEVTDEDLKKGIAKTYRASTGEIRDIRDFFKDLLNIRRGLVSPAEYPKDAYAAVFYRGSWYFIADEDLMSKEVFSIVTALYDLQSMGVQALQPLLTIPVSR